MTPALIITGAKLFCPTGSVPCDGAIATCDGAIAALGARAELLRARGPRTEVLDVPGALVTPGFHDAHAHMTDGGQSLLRIDCRTDSERELLKRVRARTATMPAGQFLVGRGWDERAWSQERPPTLAALDAAAQTHPLLLRRVCGHTAVANSHALRLAGIDSTTADPPGGRIVRNAAGNPTGLLLETAVDLVLAVVPPPTREDYLQGLRLALAEARRCGLTSVHDERGDPALYRALAEAGELTARITSWHKLGTPIAELQTWRTRFPQASKETRYRPGLLKGYLDGSLGARTAWFHAPYSDDPSISGIPVLDPDRFRALAIEADRAGFQIGVHAIGDRAVTLALDVFEHLAKAGNGLRLRHRIEHAQHMRVADVARFANAGVVASMQPSHLGSDHGMVEPRVGKDRLPGAYPWRSLLESGACVAFGSDFPIEPLDPRTSLHAAVTRQPRAGGCALAPATEAIDMAAAIRAFTMGSAYASHQEHELGTLQVGKLADLTIWAADLFDLPPADLLSVPVVRTVVGGLL